MASIVRNRGMVYWTDLENQILLNNMNKSIHKLCKLLPSRSESAIYQHKLKLSRSKPAKVLNKTSISRVYPVVENHSAQSINFTVHGVAISITFQK